jgi:small subunit ribosomal protein S2
MTEEQQGDYLVPVEEFLKAGVHIGTKFKTEPMRPFIYKIRSDGLAVLNIQKINDHIELAAKFIAQYDSKDVLIACRRENGWPAVKKFSELTGVKVFTGRYPPGVMTNIKLENFIEPKVVVVCDPFPDKNAIEDALRVGIPVLSLCDSNNKIKDLDLIIPCNNKGKKSLGLVFWLLAREVLKQKGIIKSNEEFKTDLEEFAPD